MTVGERFGTNLRRCRKRARLSQEEVAARASLHRTEIGKLEAGERRPRIDTLVIKLSAAVEAPVDELLAGDRLGTARAGRWQLLRRAVGGAAEADPQIVPLLVRLDEARLHSVQHAHHRVPVRLAEGEGGLD